jgi:diaminopropionate ammonia-lyase
VQVGVGAFAAAVAGHYRRPDWPQRPKLVAVEPESADCLFQSVSAGRLVSVPGPHDSIMAGLNCGRPSLVAWPILSRTIDLLVAVDDEPAREAMRLAARTGVVAGETGAAGLGGLLRLLRPGEDEEARRLLEINENTRVLVFNCEGATDPEAYRMVVAG